MTEDEVGVVPCFACGEPLDVLASPVRGESVDRAFGQDERASGPESVSEERD